MGDDGFTIPDIGLLNVPVYLDVDASGKLMGLSCVHPALANGSVFFYSIDNEFCVQFNYGKEGESKTVGPDYQNCITGKEALVAISTEGKRTSDAGIDRQMLAQAYDCYQLADKPNDLAEFVRSSNVLLAHGAGQSKRALNAFVKKNATNMVPKEVPVNISGSVVGGVTVGESQRGESAYVGYPISQNGEVKIPITITGYGTLPYGDGTTIWVGSLGSICMSDENGALFSVDTNLETLWANIATIFDAYFARPSDFASSIMKTGAKK
jgi:hypothetical protein